MEYFDGLLKIPFVNKVIPIGDDVVHGAALVAVRDATIHAPGPLSLKFSLREGLDEFFIMFNALLHRTVGPVDKVIF